METAATLIEQFDSFKPAEGEVPASMQAARKAMLDGIARIIPLALGKEEVIKEVKEGLARVANKLAGLSGAEVEPDPEAGPSDPVKGADPDEPAPAPAPAPEPAPSPNPLPPPPPPPLPGTGAGSRAGPAPVSPVTPGRIRRRPFSRTATGS